MVTYSSDFDHDQNLLLKENKLILAKWTKTRLKTLIYMHQSLNIAGRLPENSRNSFVDLQTKKNSKRGRPKKFVFSLKADMLYFD